MDDNTLSVILGRFDRLDEKFDRQAEATTELAGRVTAVEVKLEPVISDAKFNSRLSIFTHAVTGAVAAGIVMAVRAIWPPSVPPPSILHK